MAYTRKPVASGTFYPSDKTALKTLVESFLADTKSKHLKAIIVPHAGYIYSGVVAGKAYSLVRGQKYKTVIIIGPSHHSYLDGFGLDTADEWLTPLGSVGLDKKFIDELSHFDRIFSIQNNAFDKEHSLEVQLPFLQTVLNEFSIVPIIVGNCSVDDYKELGKILYEKTRDRDDVLIVVSTDFSHYHPYEAACSLDKSAINMILRLDGETFLKRLDKDYELCGYGPVASILFYARLAGCEIEFLDYKNSGDTSGNKSQVVGYAAMSILKTNNETNKNIQKELLNIDEKKQALKIARDTIFSYLKTGDIKNYSPDAKVFFEKHGAFVTLNENGGLRGCIGNIIGQTPLWQTIRDMSIAAATEDPRFNPVDLNELDNIHIEISILSVPLKVANVDEIVLGKHGVIVKSGFMQGVFLPQVATETGWSKGEFMGHLCRDKAGLSWDAWKNKDTEIYIFTAEVFGE